MNIKQQWLDLHFNQGLTIKKVAELSGHHPDTLYLWKRKFKQHGMAGLMDQSRSAKTRPNEYSNEIKDRIREIRKQGLKKEKRYLGERVIVHRLRRDYGIEVSESGVGKFLNDDGLIPKKRRRRPRKDRVHTCRIHEPGELLQLDVKYAVKSYQNYWYFQYDAIDYVSGVVIGDIFPCQSNLEAVTFLNRVVQRSPFSVTGIQTDNHSTFTNYYTGYKKSADPVQPRIHCFDLNCGSLSITHYLTDPGKPAQNGKIERFHRTTEDEFYRMNTFKDLNSLKQKFREYLHYYNHEREHQSLEMMTPIEKLRSFPKYEKLKEIIN